MKLLKKVRNKVNLRLIRMKVKTQKGIEGFLRRKSVMKNQAEWKKENTTGKNNKKLNKEMMKKKVKKIVKKAVANKKGKLL